RRRRILLHLQRPGAEQGGGRGDGPQGPAALSILRQRDGGRPSLSGALWARREGCTQTGGAGLAAEALFGRAASRQLRRTSRDGSDGGVLLLRDVALERPGQLADPAGERGTEDAAGPAGRGVDEATARRRFMAEPGPRHPRGRTDHCNVV